MKMEASRAFCRKAADLRCSSSAPRNLKLAPAGQSCSSSHRDSSRTLRSLRSPFATLAFT